MAFVYFFQSYHAGHKKEPSKTYAFIYISFIHFKTENIFLPIKMWKIYNAVLVLKSLETPGLTLDDHIVLFVRRKIYIYFFFGGGANLKTTQYIKQWAFESCNP